MNNLYDIHLFFKKKTLIYAISSPFRFLYHSKTFPISLLPPPLDFFLISPPPPRFFSHTRTFPISSLPHTFIFCLTLEILSIYFSPSLDLHEASMARHCVVPQRCNNKVRRNEGEMMTHCVDVVVDVEWSILFMFIIFYFDFFPLFWVVGWLYFSVKINFFIAMELFLAKAMNLVMKKLWMACRFAPLVKKL